MEDIDEALGVGEETGWHYAIGGENYKGDDVADGHCAADELEMASGEVGVSVYYESYAEDDVGVIYQC